MALFLDRPFGAGKAPAEPDGTLLLASEAYSRSIAEQRLNALAQEPGLLPDAERDACLRRLQEGAETHGLSLDAVGGDARPGTVSLTDARRAATDFVLLRTTPGSVRALLEQYDFTALAEKMELDWLLKGGRVLLARDAAGRGCWCTTADAAAAGADPAGRWGIRPPGWARVFAGGIGGEMDRRRGLGG